MPQSYAIKKQSFTDVPSGMSSGNKNEISAIRIAPPRARKPLETPQVVYNATCSPWCCGSGYIWTVSDTFVTWLSRLFFVPVTSVIQSAEIYGSSMDI